MSCFEGAYRLILEEDEQGRPVLVLHARPDTRAGWTRWSVIVATSGERAGEANSINGEMPFATTQDADLTLGRVYPLEVEQGQRMVVSFSLDGPGQEGYHFFCESVQMLRAPEGYAILEETRIPGKTAIGDAPPPLLTLTPQKEAPETVPIPEVERYELTIALPVDLPDKAIVYSSRPVADVAGWAQRIAGALGFEGEPAYANKGCNDQEWAWGKAHSSSALTTYGDYAFQASDPQACDTGTGGLKTAEAAIAAARDWLLARGLLPQDCRILVTASPTNLSAEPRGDIWNPGWEICFQRVLDGVPVGRFWTSGIRMHIWSNGRIGFLTYVHRTVDDQTLYALRPVEEAWEELQNSGPIYFDTDSPVRPRYDLAHIEEISLSYRESEVARRQTHFLPLYAFRGTVHIGGYEDGFVAYVPALRGEFAIYLLAQRISAGEISETDLSDLELEDEPILAVDDIVSYVEETHRIELTASAYERIWQLEVPTSGIPFVVCVGRDPIYGGAFWVGYSSMGFDGVVIDTLPASRQKPIQIQLGYPSGSFFSGEDPRSNPRILRSLEQAGKLK